jgi:hypothetical protein
MIGDLFHRNINEPKFINSVEKSNKSLTPTKCEPIRALDDENFSPCAQDEGSIIINEFKVNTRAKPKTPKKTGKRQFIKSKYLNKPQPKVKQSNTPPQHTLDLTADMR